MSVCEEDLNLPHGSTRLKQVLTTRATTVKGNSMRPSQGDQVPDYFNKVARKFVSLYYRVLNDYEGYLHRFYGSDSTVVVSEVGEHGEQTCMKAEDADTVHRLLTTVYAAATVTVRSCTPQLSAERCLSLLVAGAMSRKNGSEMLTFTQALVLSRQTDGYYIKTDTVLLVHQTPTGEAKGGFLESALPSTATSVSNEGLMRTSSMAQEQSVFSMNTQMSNDEDSKGRNPPNVNHVGPISHTGVHQGHAEQTIDIGSTQTQANRNETVESVTSIIGRTHSEDVLCTSTRPTSSNTQTAFIMHLAGNDRGPSDVGAVIHSSNERSGSPCSAPATIFPLIVPPPQRPESDHTQFQSQPQNPSVEATINPPPTELRSLFACKLPLDVTVEELTDLFSWFGPLVEDTPVKVFTGPKNCYAYVNFTNEESMQNALKGDTLVRGNEIVKEVWRPREPKPGRRRRRNLTNESRAVNAN